MFRIDNNVTEKCETKNSWHSAMAAAKRLAEGHRGNVIIREYESQVSYRDGDAHIAEWDGFGRKLQEDGHYR